MDKITEIISKALAEDIGSGDHTTLACIHQGAMGRAQLLVKEDGVLSGSDIARRVFEMEDVEMIFEKFIEDGSPIKNGDIVFSVAGRVHTILKCERLVLNIMQRMSGIATRTAHYVSLVEGTGVRIIDTRKTTPNLRILEKLAVRAGGGYNHRMGLYDMILIKDNHIDFAGGIKMAITQANKYLEQTLSGLEIVVEVRNFRELEEVLEVGQVKRIMLDNFSVEDTRKALSLVGGRYETEASGGITEKNIRQVAQTGVTFISVGALTHHIKSLDLSLKAVIH